MNQMIRKFPVLQNSVITLGHRRRQSIVKVMTIGHDFFFVIKEIISGFPLFFQ